MLSEGPSPPTHKKAIDFLLLVLSEDDDDAMSQLSSSVPHRYKGVLKVSVLNERPGGAFGSGSTDGDADGSEGPRPLTRLVTTAR